MRVTLLPDTMTTSTVRVSIDNSRMLRYLTSVYDTALHTLPPETYVVHGDKYSLPQWVAGMVLHHNSETRVDGLCFTSHLVGSSSMADTHYVDYVDETLFESPRPCW